MIGRTMLRVKEVASILGVTVARVYQLDDVLRPHLSARGEHMTSRHYDPERVEAYRDRRDELELQEASQSLWQRLRARTDAHVTISEAAAAALAREPCACCGATPSPLNELARVDNSRDYSVDNLVACCRACARIKGSSDVQTLVQRAWAIAQWQTRST